MSDEYIADNPPMPKELYAVMQKRLMQSGALLVNQDWLWFIQSINTAEALAPIIDPTLYLAAGERMKAIKKCAEIANEFSIAFDELVQAVSITPASHALIERNKNRGN